jgi:hypothetical protein
VTSRYQTRSDEHQHAIGSGHATLYQSRASTVSDVSLAFSTRNQNGGADIADDDDRWQLRVSIGEILGIGLVVVPVLTLAGVLAGFIDAINIVAVALALEIVLIGALHAYRQLSRDRDSM